MPARKIGENWWSDFRFGGKRYRFRPEKNTKVAAQALERRLIAQLEDGEPIERKRGRRPTKAARKPKPGTPTFAEYLPEWLEGTRHFRTGEPLKPSDRAAKEGIIRNHIIPTVGDVPVPALTAERTEAAVKAWREGGASNKTVANRLAVLRKACEDYAGPGGTPTLPPAVRGSVRRKKAIVWLDKAQSDAVLEHVEPRWYPLVLTAFRTGLRRGELLGLQWQDVDFSRGVLTVRRALVDGLEVKPKSGLERQVPISPQLGEVLGSMKRVGRWVFQLDGKPLTRGLVKSILPRACRAAGVREIQWHACRHSYCSQLVLAGTPLTVVQRLAGHESVRVAEQYLHATGVDAAGYVAGLD